MGLEILMLGGIKGSMALKAASVGWAMMMMMMLMMLMMMCMSRCLSDTMPLYYLHRWERIR